LKKNIISYTNLTGKLYYRGIMNLFLKDWGGSSQETHLHPSIYKRIRITKKLLRKGIDPEEFRSRGGLDLETFRALQQRWNDQKQRMDKVKQEIRSTYGTLKNAPISVGACRKIEPVIGTKNALVLLTEFKDKKSSTKPEFFKDLLFSKGSNRSLRDYYLEASWNQLDIDGEVNEEWYTSANKRSEYVDKIQVGGHYPKAQKLVEETIIKAKNSDSFDFTPYSKDGNIEILIVVYAGAGMDTKLDINYIRAHQDRLKQPIEVQDGIWARRYCIIPELPFLERLGVLCHEVGHILGLPDLYKEDYSPVVGSWCLMGMGHYINEGRTPSHPSAWCKVHLGWVEPKLLNQEPQNYEIPAVIDDKSIYRLDVEGSDGREYFLLENRQQKGFDKNLPGSGLLIWHINENACKVQLPNSDPQHFFLTLKQSDGKEDLQSDRTELFMEKYEEIPKDVAGDLGDPFPGITVNRTFDDESSPNSRSYKGNKSFVKVVSISDSKDLMNAEMGVKPISKATTQFIPKNKTVTFTKKTAIKLTPPNLLTFLYPPKPKDPYEEGWEAYFEDLKEEIGLKEFQAGYRRGYRRRYKEAVKKVKK
jgi:immune inhibitor A